MAEGETTTTPEPKGKESNSKTMLIVGVVALLAVGGILLLNSNSPKEVAEDAVEDAVEVAEDNVEEVANIEDEMDQETGTIVDVAQSANVFNTLVAALQATGLDSALADVGPFTVFAPTDEAFAKLPEGTVESLLQNPTELADILKYHVVAGKVMSDQVTDGLEAPTLQGKAVVFSVDENGEVTVNGAKVVQADVNARNGVIHVVDTVLLPATE